MDTEERKQKKGLTGSVLKWIAIVTMFIDHLGAAFFENGFIPYLVNNAAVDARREFWSNIDVIFRLVGRTAFPIFCFLIVEGYLHTRNVKKYLLRLGIFALVSEIPFDIAFMKSWWDISYQNVYFTLFLGLAAISFIDYFTKKMPKYSTIWKIAGMVIFGGLAVVLSTDYDCIGVILIVVLFLLRENELLRDIVAALVLLGAGFSEVAGYFAFLFLHAYNGKRGTQPKYFFYLFYPLHLLLLAGLRMLVFGA